MNHMLIVITYSLPGTNPVITSAVVPFENHMSFDRYKQDIHDDYRHKQYYQVTISQI